MSRERYEIDAHCGDSSSDFVEYVLVDKRPFVAYLGLFVCLYAAEYRSQKCNLFQPKG
jgi:hypothetical protein